jgi:regulator of cell morphogenesis and NO signaling
MPGSPEKITPDLLVTDIVTNNYRTAEVFRKYNIDFCSAAGISLNAACMARGLNESNILEELQQFNSAYQNAEQWSENFMIDYLLNVHHNYFKNNMPVLVDYIDKFILSHRTKSDDLAQFPLLIQKLQDKIISLLDYESKSLFPYIRRISYAHNNNEIYGKLFIKTLRKLSVEELEQYHAQIKILTLEIELLTDNFSPVETTCTTQQVLLQKLREFIDHIEQHFSIEKKILIPSILQMEKTLLERFTEI